LKDKLVRARVKFTFQFLRKILNKRDTNIAVFLSIHVSCSFSYNKHKVSLSSTMLSLVTDIVCSVITVLEKEMDNLSHSSPIITVYLHI
jgi:hypothetical protein